VLKIQDAKNRQKFAIFAQSHKFVGLYPKACINNRKKLLNSNISSTCPLLTTHGELQPTNGWDWFVSLEHPANFNSVRVFVSLLHRRRSTEVNQTLHDVWPSPGLVHYVHWRRILPPNGILTGAKFTLRPNLAFSYIGSVTARHSRSGRQPNFAAFSRGRHLYSAGRPSRWYRPTF